MKPETCYDQLDQLWREVCAVNPAATEAERIVWLTNTWTARREAMITVAQARMERDDWPDVETRVLLKRLGMEAAGIQLANWLNKRPGSKRAEERRQKALDNFKKYGPFHV